MLPHSSRLFFGVCPLLPPPPFLPSSDSASDLSPGGFLLLLLLLLSTRRLPLLTNQLRDSPISRLTPMFHCQKHQKGTSEMPFGPLVIPSMFPEIRLPPPPHPPPLLLPSRRDKKRRLYAQKSGFFGRKKGRASGGGASKIQAGEKFVTPRRIRKEGKKSQRGR